MQWRATSCQPSSGLHNLFSASETAQTCPRNGVGRELRRETEASIFTQNVFLHGSNPTPSPVRQGACGPPAGSKRKILETLARCSPMLRTTLRALLTLLALVFLA